MDHKKWYRYYFDLNVRLQKRALEDVDIIKEGRFFHHKTGFTHLNPRQFRSLRIARQGNALRPWQATQGPTTRSGLTTNFGCALFGRPKVWQTRDRNLTLEEDVTMAKRFKLMHRREVLREEFLMP